MKNLIKQIRISKGITQQELSEKAGVSRPYIAKLENSESNEVMVCTMQKIADALEEKLTNVFLLNA